jgi:hypothetical protein
LPIVSFASLSKLLSADIQNSSLLTPSLLDSFPDAGQNQFLSIPEDHNPQPLVTDKRANYLFGPAGQEGGLSRGKNGRGIVEEDVYGFWVDRGKDVVVSWVHLRSELEEERLLICRIYGIGPFTLSILVNPLGGSASWATVSRICDFRQHT